MAHGPGPPNGAASWAADITAPDFRREGGTRHSTAAMLRQIPDRYIELLSDRVGDLMLRFVSASLFIAVVFAGAPALANEFCDKELAPLVQQRTAFTAKLQEIGKHAKQ